MGQLRSDPVSPPDAVGAVPNSSENVRLIVYAKNVRSLSMHTGAKLVQLLAEL